jgi:hypothetical protein
MKIIKKYKAPISILLLFLVIIFGFAYAFSQMDNEFYHTTIQFESTTKEAYQTIKIQLTDLIRNSYLIDENNNPGEIRYGSWYISYEDIKAVDFYVDDQNFTINIFAFINHIGDDGRLQTSLTFDLIYNGLSFSPGSDEMTYEFYIDNEDSIDFNKLGIEEIMLNEMFNKNGSDIIQITVHNELSRYIETYNRSLQGFPSRLEGDFLRMLYLSMVTITTLGYGDIVPITDKARILVGIESVLGIILIGWFATTLLNKLLRMDND